MDAALFYKDHGDSAYVRAVGHITARLCPALKEKVCARMSSDPALRAVRVDLSQCEYMDSTFLGLLVTIRKGLRALPGAELTLHAPNETCRDLLKGIGIMQLVKVTDDVPEFPSLLATTAPSDEIKPEFVLDVHEELMELSEENRRRFATLHAVLKKKIEENPPDKPDTDGTD